MAKKSNKSFEDSLSRLHEISELLESTEVGLEESVKLYEEGMKLSKECYKVLDKAELKITELKKKLESEI